MKSIRMSKYFIHIHTEGMNTCLKQKINGNFVKF